MPGLMVREPLVRLMVPKFFPLPTGAARLANGSAIDLIPVMGVGLRMAPLLALTPPTTWMLPAVIREVPLALRADGELESTTTAPPMLGSPRLIATEPVRVKAPLTVGLSTKIEGCTVMVKLVEAIWPPSSTMLTVTV